MPKSPIAERVTAPASFSSTAQTTPASAKSPLRRAISSTTKPQRPSHTGKWTAVSTSSGSSVVVQVPSKKSAAGMRRDEPVRAASSSASSASATAGSSEAESAWAIEPPTVPRLRIWKWPISGSALASERRRGGHGLVVLGDGLTGHGPDRERPVLALDAAQLRRPG